MELLVTEIAKGDEDLVAPSLRTVIEASFPNLLPSPAFYSCYWFLLWFLVGG